MRRDRGFLTVCLRPHVGRSGDRSGSIMHLKVYDIRHGFKDLRARVMAGRWEVQRVQEAAGDESR